MIKKIFLYFVQGLLITINTSTFANVSVTGWPQNHIAMGTAVDGGTYAAQELASRPVDAIFTYAGNSGSGDRGVFIPIDKKVQNVIEQTHQLEEKTGKNIMPVIVFYSVDGSDGVWAIQQDLNIDSTADPNNLKYHYANLIRLCQLIESYKDAKHPVPASLILNPDFLGEMHKQCSQYYCPISNNQLIPVASNLSQAIKFLQDQGFLDKDIKIPQAFQKPNSTIADYNASINWLVKTFAPDIPFGWQDNVWAGDQSGHLWLHHAQHSPGETADKIVAETNFLQQMNIFSKDYSPDFLVFDKWERDVFDHSLGGAGITNGYLYNSQDWDIYMKFVSGISHNFNNVPLMLWQIPGGHLQITNDTDSRKDHASTAADYFLGDDQLAGNLANLSDYIAKSTFSAPANYATTSNKVIDYLSCPATNSHCWQQNRLPIAAQNNVFAILWGGGSTTGIAGITSALDDNGWLSARLKALQTSQMSK